ncbi:hypothetical protein ACETKC_10200 [Brevundimonas intermedia]|uniref:hypothetical protein n=1 Tax=Brevundimonas intermedia TaxID=74315 RepID=UPI0022F29086|nr:hypothetical protein [Brevundimonas intermedia]
MVFLNRESSGIVEMITNDRRRRTGQSRLVEKNWFLQQWLDHFNKRQASLVNELGWDKSRANFVYHGKQPYRRDLVNEIAAWLQIEPYELLMDPQEAIAIRYLRAAARSISEGSPLPASTDPAPKAGRSPNARRTKPSIKAA